MAIDRNIVGATTIVALLFGGSWTVFQTQFGYQDKEIVTLREVLSAKAKADKDDTDRRFEALDAGIAKINDTLRSDISGVLVSRNEFSQFQFRVEDLRQQFDAARQKIDSVTSKEAHTPVEKETIDAVVNAIDKQIQLIQGQITDINRQIAAALIIIDNNSLTRKAPMLPP